VILLLIIFYLKKTLGIVTKTLLIFSILIILGCASSPTTPQYNNSSVLISDSSSTKQRLHAQLAKWKNVKYRLGGLSKSGIDCSGFVYLTFQSEFGIKLPRSTQAQAKAGRFVKQRDLKIGDLVFFKTSHTVRHVGIYLGKREFIHASTSRGVTISKLDNVYWKKRYWKSVRVSV